MAISLSTVKKIKKAADPICVLYAPPGKGKTTVAAEFPDTIWLQLAGESMPSDLPPPDGWGCDDIEGYGDIVQAIGILLNEEHAFRTLVIDSATPLETIVKEETCTRNGWKDLEEPGYGKGYVAMEAVWLELLDGLAALRNERGMTIVIIAHCEIVRFDSPVTDPYSRYKVALHKNVLPYLEDYADIIAFLNTRATLKQADVGFNKKVTHAEGGGKRVLYLEERPGFMAKNRYGMPPEINIERGKAYEALAQYIYPDAA
ncbi:ATP-binding protein [Amorphus sp. MBR-141]